MTPEEINLENMSDIKRALDRVQQILDEYCCQVCKKPGPGLTITPDGRQVHRWPCRERLFD